MLDDGGPHAGQGPGRSFDLSQPLVLVLQQLEAATSTSIDDPEQLVDRLADEILAQPPSQRFQTGARSVEERINEEFGSVDVFQSQIPLSGHVAFGLFQQIIDGWANNIGENTLDEDSRQNQRGLLAVLSALDLLQATISVLESFGSGQDEVGFQEIHDELSEDERYQLASILFVLYARLYRVIQADQEGEAPDFDALATDVLYGEQALEQVLDPQAEQQSLKQLHRKQKRRGALVRGAVRMYDDFEITVGKGAELAGVSQTEFVDILEQTGVRPEYGPDSTEDFYSGPNLIDEQ